MLGAFFSKMDPEMFLKNSHVKFRIFFYNGILTFRLAKVIVILLLSENYMIIQKNVTELSFFYKNFLRIPRNVS